MKKIVTTMVAAAALFTVSPVWLACSDDEPSEKKEEQSPGKFPSFPQGNLEVPQEVIDKIHEIYDHASVDAQTVTTVNQLAILTSVCASQELGGPISVTGARLNGKAITLVTLGGTEEKEGQATTMKESQLASFGKPNDYLAALTDLFNDGTIPSEKPVLVTGISLGGMIAQQLLGEQSIVKSFDLIGIVTFGSPITLPVDRQGVKVVRFADVHDQVPKMGESLIRSGLVTSSEMSKAELEKKLNELDETEKVTATSKYTGMIETHALSYVEDDCWNQTDFLGDPEKKNVLELLETMHFYPAPKR